MFSAIQYSDRRQLEPDGSGPIRRRIKSLTIKLEPFETSLTNQQASNVRNAIESLLKKYFFEVQPWVDESNIEIVSSDGENENSIKTSIHDSTNYRASASDFTPEGSVTYVGLAQILENKLTEGGVELTMNGLVYFAEGSKNIPDENELLQTMKTQALGDSEVVVEALQDLFPQQQELVVTVKTPLTEATDVPTEEKENDIVTIEIADDPWVDVQQQEPESNQLGISDSPTSPLNTGGNAGMITGVAVVAVAALAVLVGLLAIKRRRFRKGADAKERLVGVGTSSEDGDHEIENGFYGRQEDWKANSNDPVTNETEILPRPSNNARSYLSTVFHRKSPVAEQHLNMLNNAEVVRKSVTEGTYEDNNNQGNLSNFEFTDDGLSDFDDAVSIQPHMMNLKSLESFEEQHTNLTHNQIYVQKDMLGSSFEEAPTSLLGQVDAGASQTSLTCNSTQSTTPSNRLLLSNTHTGATAASGGDLSYSSSSTSSQIHDNLMLLHKNSFGGSVTEQQQEQGDEQDHQRIRYSMPDPYVHNKSTVHGRQKAAEAAVFDRSAPCVLQSTDFTASSLARGRDSIKDNSSEAGSSISLMVPKLAAPTWWTGKENPGKRASAAAEEAYLTDDMAYSGDEENTFGVADSDGWDPADTALSSMGDAPTQEMMDELDLHMGVVLTNPSSATPKKNRNQDPPGTSPMKKKYEEPSGLSPLRSMNRISPNIQAAKSILQKMKAQEDDEVNTSMDSIENAKFVLQKMKSSSDGDQHQLGESIASVFESDTDPEEIEFNLEDTMEI